MFLLSYSSEYFSIDSNYAAISPTAAADGHLCPECEPLLSHLMTLLREAHSRQEVSSHPCEPVRSNEKFKKPKKIANKRSITAQPAPRYERSGSPSPSTSSSETEDDIAPHNACDGDRVLPVSSATARQRKADVDAQRAAIQARETLTTEARRRYLHLDRSKLRRVHLPVPSPSLPYDTVNTALNSLHSAIRVILTYGEGYDGDDWFPGWEVPLRTHLEHVLDSIKNAPSQHRDLLHH